MNLFLLTVTAALLHSARSQSPSLGFDDGLSNAAAHITQAHSLRDIQNNVGAFASGVGGGSLSGFGSFPSDALSAGFGANPGLGHVASIPGFPSSNLPPFSGGLGSPFSTGAGVSPFFAGSVIPGLHPGAQFPSFPNIPTINSPLSPLGLNGLPGFQPFHPSLVAQELSGAINPFSSNLPHHLPPFSSAFGTPLFPQFSSGLGLSTPGQVISPFA